MFDYYRRLLRAAFGASALGETIGRMDLWSGVLAAVCAVLAHYMPPEMGERMNALLWQIPLWVFAAVLIARLARAPYLMDKQANEQIGALSLALDNRDAKQSALSLLWALRKEGVTLRNKPLTQGELAEWLANTIAWRNRVYNAAAVVSVNLRNHLETLNEMGGVPDNFKPTAGAMHLHHAKVTSEVLRRLERYLEKDL